MDINQRIKEQLDSNPIIIYMKGTPQFPQCGFSSRTSQALMACNVEFAHVNILADPELREGLKVYSSWPTYPQVYVDGELIGGCDIVMDLFEKGELQRLTAEAGGKSQ